MGIICLPIVIWALFSILKDYEPWDKKVKRMDNDPNCRLKSDKWLKEHRYHLDSWLRVVDKDGNIIIP